MSTHEEILDFARLAFDAIVVGGETLGTAERDQFQAGAAEAEHIVTDMAALLASMGPTWSSRTEERLDRRREAFARCYAAVQQCPTICCHLRAGGPQPAMARLPLRRLDCRRCAGTLRKPPAGDADRCDWCGDRGVATFVPIVLQCGVFVVAGDACPTCATALEVGS